MIIFDRGVHPPENKNTHDSPTIHLDSFSKVQIPMSMHVGKPCKPVVKVGDLVGAGQVIGDSDDYFSPPIHSSVSGKVISVRRVVASSGVSVEVVEIESDGLYNYHESVRPPKVTDKKSFIKAVRDSGLVGLGGATFPTHVKLDPPEGKHPDTLLINSAECEPYITTDYRICIEHPEEIIGGILEVLDKISIPSAIIGIEENKPLAIKILNHQIEKAGCKNKISVKAVKTKYPKGAEKTLIYHVLERKVPTGGLPHDVGVLVLNVGTVRFIKKYLDTGIPLIRKYMTFDGDVLVSPCNVNVPIGAFIGDIIELIGGVKQTPSKIIMGGPMMGIAMDRMDFGVIKGHNAALLLSRDSAFIPDEAQCMKCSRCVDVCPMNLLPTSIDIYARNKDVEELKNHNTNDCFECGCCTYVCPAKRYLMQNIRYGKTLLNTEEKK